MIRRRLTLTRRRARVALASGVAAVAILALLAAVLLPGSSTSISPHHRSTPPAVGSAGDEAGGASAAVASPPTLVPDTAVTVTPAPQTAGPPPAKPPPAPSGSASSGSGSSQPRPSPPPPPTYPAPTPEPNRAAPSQPPPAAPAPGAVLAGDFPDPDVLRVGAVYYAYSTQVGATWVPVLRSVDLVHWETAGNALGNLPPWSGGASVWAPSVGPSRSGYVLFYSTRDNRTGDQCISRAESILPQGPFFDMSANPFVCQLNLGGSIDPYTFVDSNGAQWLIWKSQGTASGKPPQIWAQAVGGDWRFLVGQPTPLLSVTQAWENGVVEAPALARVGNLYYLLYSGNYWNRSSYAIGYAVCRSVTGPCTKPHSGPVLASHGTEAGPGSASIFRDTFGHLRVAFHAWTPPHIGYPGGERSLHLGTLQTTGGQLSISEP